MDYITIIEEIKKSWREKVEVIKTAYNNDDDKKIKEYCALIQNEAVKYIELFEKNGLYGGYSKKIRCYI